MSVPSLAGVSASALVQQLKPVDPSANGSQVHHRHRHKPDADPAATVGAAQSSSPDAAQLLNTTV